MTSPVIIDQKKLKASGLPTHLQVLITQLVNLANRPAVKGAPGRGIAAIDVDQDSGALTIRMTDGVQVVTPALMGADGAPGTALPAGAGALWPAGDAVPAGWFEAGAVGGGWIAISQTETQPPAAIDYTQAIAYIDASAAYAGSASAVTSITSIGQQGLVFVGTGSGTPITHSAAGFTFGGGVYLQTAILAAGSQPTGDGLFAVIDITLTSYGSNDGQLLQGIGGRINILDVSGALRVLGYEDSSINVAAGATPYGTRFVIGGRMDDLADLLGVYDVTGTYTEQAYANTDPDLTRISTGRYINGTLHRLAVFGRPEGGAWPASFEDVFADFRAGV